MRIDLTWREQMAAYLAITWPAAIASLFAQFLWLAQYNYLDDAFESMTAIGLASNGLFFLLQWLFTPRLVSKRFRGFKILVLRDMEQRPSRLTRSEWTEVWLWIFLPQFMLLLGVSTFVWFFERQLTQSTLQRISTAAIYVRYFILGPIGLKFALNVSYSRFRFIVER